MRVEVVAGGVSDERGGKAGVRVGRKAAGLAGIVLTWRGVLLTREDVGSEFGRGIRESGGDSETGKEEQKE